MIAKIFNLVMSSLSATPIYFTNNYINNLSYQNNLQADDPIKVLEKRLYELNNNLDIKLKGLYDLKKGLNKKTFKAKITEQKSQVLYSNRKYLPYEFDKSDAYKNTQNL